MAWSTDKGEMPLARYGSQGVSHGTGFHQQSLRQSDQTASRRAAEHYIGLILHARLPAQPPPLQENRWTSESPWRDL